MKYAIALFIASLGILPVQAQDFKERFNSAIVDLADNRVEHALENLKLLYETDSTNMNLAYLYGQALVRADSNLDRATRLLEKATSNYNPDYRKGDYTEETVSEYVFYYLLMGYSKLGNCDKTLEVLNSFYRLYSYENEWYLVRGQELHLNCEQRKKDKETATSPTDTAEPVVVTAERPVGKALMEELMVGTQPLEYTSKAAIYSVQVAAVLYPVFTYEFEDLKNIEVYVDENGVFRYSIGRFLFRQQAERLLKVVQETGYEDAFIVNVKDKQRYSEEVLTINRENIHKRLVGEVDFRVQVGAFKGDTIPDEMMQLYLRLDSIRQVEIEDQTIITSGSFDNYDAAQLYAEVLHETGINGAFVTAWNYNRRVDIKQAIAYLKAQREARKEDENEND